MSNYKYNIIIYFLFFFLFRINFKNKYNGNHEPSTHTRTLNKMQNYNETLDNTIAKIEYNIVNIILYGNPYYVNPHTKQIHYKYFNEGDNNKTIQTPLNGCIQYLITLTSTIYLYICYTCSYLPSLAIIN